MNMFDKKQQIPIASDHGGFELKQVLIEELIKKEYHIVDMGTFGNESVDYADFIHPLAKAVNDGKYSMGIIICGSGQGASMTANKYPRVRSALLWDIEQAKLTRNHNDANVVALPGRFINQELALQIVEAFLNEKFEGGRHIKRVNKMSEVLK